MAGHQIPMTGGQAVDRYFLEMRGKLIEIAAALDRIQRCREGASALQDYRIAALRQALGELLSPELGRAERVQLMLSDPTTEPIPAADDPMAYGAPLTGDP